MTHIRTTHAPILASCTCRCRRQLFSNIGGWGWGWIQAYSRLSTTHGHITDHRLQVGFGGVCRCMRVSQCGPVLLGPNDLRPTVFRCQATHRSAKVQSSVYVHVRTSWCCYLHESVWLGTVVVFVVFGILKSQLQHSRQCGIYVHVHQCSTVKKLWSLILTPLTNVQACGQSAWKHSRRRLRKKILIPESMSTSSR